MKMRKPSEVVGTLGLPKVESTLVTFAKAIVGAEWRAGDTDPYGAVERECPWCEIEEWREKPHEKGCVVHLARRILKMAGAK